MAIAAIKKVQIVAHAAWRELILDELQQKGIVEITNLREKLSSSDYKKFLRDREIDLQELEGKLAHLEDTLEFLAPFEKGEKKSLVKEFIKSKVIIKREELLNLINNFDYKTIYQECHDLEHRLSDLKNREAKLVAVQQHLLPWANLPLPLEECQETQKTKVVLGIMSPLDYRKFIEALLEFTEPIYVELIAKDKKANYLLLVHLKEDEERLLSLLKRHNFSQVIFSDLKGTATQNLVQIREDLSQIEKEREDLKKRAKELAKERVKLMSLYDHFFNLKTKLEAQRNFAETEQAFMLEGWIRKRDVKELTESLGRSIQEVGVFISDPEEGEVVPVDLENPRLIAPFEIVTELYGLPHRLEVDPTPIIAFFYSIFFGFCLTDAGYGLVLALLMLLFIRRLKVEDKRVFYFFFWCSISTVVLGAITGGWFGDLINYLPSSLDWLKRGRESMMLFDPLDRLLLFMGLALFLGVVHVFTGMLIKAYKNIRTGAILDAVYDQFSWLTLLSSLIVLGLGKFDLLSPSLIPYAKGGAILGALIIVLFGGRSAKNIFARMGLGIYSLYGISSYLGDVLSYVRLLALGLGTGVIANTVNLMAGLLLGVPYAGPILMVIFLLIGHVFNITMNILGAFVHSLRLHYVEFFGKFFEGGGRPFKPFKVEGKYTVVKEV